MREDTAHALLDLLWRGLMRLQLSSGWHMDVKGACTEPVATPERNHQFSSTQMRRGVVAGALEKLAEWLPGPLMHLMCRCG